MKKNYTTRKGWIQMKGYRINPNKEHTNLIIEGLLEKDGYCPCKIQKTEENKCPCDDFLNTGKCCCKLWVKEE